MDVVTGQMVKALERLQDVAGFDYSAAYYAAFTGMYILDPRGDTTVGKTARDMYYGRSLALRVWANRQDAITDLRHAA